MDLKFEIEIDGGINNETSKICIENGADVLSRRILYIWTIFR